MLHHHKQMSLILNLTSALILHLENMRVFIAKFGLKSNMILVWFLSRISLTGFGLAVDFVLGERQTS